MDKDLESIVSGKGLSESSTENSSQSGITIEQRGVESGTRIDQYDLKKSQKSDK